jgi:hypothetical protein
MSGLLSAWTDQVSAWMRWSMRRRHARSMREGSGRRWESGGRGKGSPVVDQGVGPDMVEDHVMKDARGVGGVGEHPRVGGGGVVQPVRPVAPLHYAQVRGGWRCEGDEGDGVAPLPRTLQGPQPHSHLLRHLLDMEQVAGEHSLDRGSGRDLRKPVPKRRLSRKEARIVIYRYPKDINVLTSALVAKATSKTRLRKRIIAHCRRGGA